MTLSDLTGSVWRKSSRSGAGNDCVELVVARNGAAVRDSKSPETGHIAFAGAGWNAFVGVLKEGRYDSA
ncbi:DUF397 domain-containing protein [Actinophytocola gossypii]|uniref:DUF397 domain-containing protein n=1 Tax=Actinophytocola gossypii TaxID=2812003 RepID=A0ABT2JBU3_9PSEU|nr:DUF397 domain-containing protein [Actinophytocola gossypii]MCT2585332.1 DUF397 domain-containing protein [Actinophytocola gossypii]